MKLFMPATVVFLLFLQSPSLSHAQPKTRPKTFEGTVTIRNPGSAVDRASLEGMVVSDATGEPLAGATVTLFPRGLSSVIAILKDSEFLLPSPVTTNERGQFSFPAIESASYAIAVRKDGYVAQEFGQRAGGSDAGLAVKPGERINGFELRLTPSGRIAGHVRHQSGQPESGVAVHLFKANYVDVEQVQSGDDGLYRLDGFAPGKYILVVGSPLTLNGQSPRSFVTSVDVAPGETKSIDFTLDTEDGAKSARGLVKSGRTGLPLSTVRWTVGAMPQRILGEYEVSRIQYNPQSGEFEVPDLFPGIYRIFASGPESADTTSCGEIEIVVSQTSVTGLELTLAECQQR